MEDNTAVRVTAKADYALRAALELAAAEGGGPVKGERIAQAQGIPIRFLENILLELRHAGLVQSQRGAEGGYWLARPAAEINLADILRVVEGPLANVRGVRPEEVEYEGAAEHLREVWIAVRANLRAVLESASLAEIVRGELPGIVQGLARDRGLAPPLNAPRHFGKGSDPVTRVQRSSRPGRGLAEGLGPRGLDVDDLAALELEPLRLVAGELRRDLAAVLEQQLDAHLETEMHHALDHRLACAVARLQGQVEVVRADETAAEPVHGADERHHEFVRGVFVEVAGRTHLLDLPGVHDWGPGLRRPGR